MSKYEVTITGHNGSTYSVTAESEGEMLDRVRIHSQSNYVATVTVRRYAV